eukprot:2294675-Pleurochrysis_carterae.AAC.7
MQTSRRHARCKHEKQASPVRRWGRPRPVSSRSGGGLPRVGGVVLPSTFGGVCCGRSRLQMG